MYACDLLAAHAVTPERHPEWPPLDLCVDAGMTLLLASDRHRAHRYLRLLGGVDPVGQGHVALLGEQNGQLDREAWLALRRQVGYLLDEGPLLSVLSVEDNLLLPALYHGEVEPLALRAEAHRLLERLGVDSDHLRLLPAFLAPDQRRVVALVRCLLAGQRLLLLESPLAGIDLLRARHTRELLHEWCHTGQRALVVADNDLQLARRADTLVVLGSGACHTFHGWDALCASPTPEVRQLLTLLDPDRPEE